MAILHRFLRLLEFLEYVADVADAFAESLTVPAGVALLTCLLSYQALLVAGCGSLSSAILASAVALALHCGFNRPSL